MKFTVGKHPYYLTGQGFTIRKAEPEEHAAIGQLMVNVYSTLPGFPKPTEQPKYYDMLAHIGEWANKPGTELLVAVAPDHRIAGAVVFFGNMKYYGSGGIATTEKDASGFRLLAVSDSFRGKGIGKLLSGQCIRKSKELGKKQLIIHSTKAMDIAWRMYEKLGFRRSEDLDFTQGDLPVYGFRLELS